MNDRKRMLVIDDEEIVVTSCERIFSEEGFEIVSAGNSKEGLAEVETSRFDVILCDWKLPDIDGVELVDLIDKRAPDSAILMITGFPSVGRATDVMKRGAVDYVPKPFTPDEIVEAVRKALKKKADEKSARSLLFPIPGPDDKAPQTIAETVSQKVGVGKTTSPWFSVLVLGILAGAYIGFGGMLATTVTFDMGGTFGVGFTKLVSGSVFSLGLILVIIAGAELFTGNNLMISSAMTKEITFGKMLERWGLVYVANFIGSVVIALLFVFSGLWKTGGGALGASAVKIAYAKVNLTFVEALLRGVGCNWLVCLAVWMALASRQTIGKIFAIFFPIMGFVALGFEHSVANMYFISTALFLRGWEGVGPASGYTASSLSWLSFFWKSLLPVTIGNIIGGSLFVGMSYWSAYLRPARASLPHGEAT